MTELTQLNFSLNESTTESERERERASVSEWDAASEHESECKLTPAPLAALDVDSDATRAAAAATATAANLCHIEHICVAYFSARRLACSHAAAASASCCVALRVLRLICFANLGFFSFLSQPRNKCSNEVKLKIESHQGYLACK